MESSFIQFNSKKNLTNQQRNAIFQLLLAKSSNGKLKKGTIGEVAAIFSVNVKTISRIWQRGKAAVVNGGLFDGAIVNGTGVDVSSRKATRVGRKRIQIEPNNVKQVLFHKRKNIRSISNDLQVPKSTIHRRIKEGMMRAHTNAIKPFLSDENKRARLRFCLSMLQPSSIGTEPLFQSMYNFIHIDEKWFFMTKESERYYLLPEEQEPHRKCKSKRFITKVMFLAAVARPRFDAHQNEVFSGKIGIFPFTYREPAKRSSKNRCAGTLETKAITSVTKEVTRKCMIEKVLPTIRSKWPRSFGMETIYIQQDNARPHILPSDVEFVEASRIDGFDIRLSCQPSNSPDLNVLDLGFFRAIQSLQYQEAPTTIDALVAAVEKSFDELSAQTLDRVFVSLQSCMIEVMKVYGGNNYKLPHLGKSQLMRDDNLPPQLHCEKLIVENAVAHQQD